MTTFETQTGQENMNNSLMIFEGMEVEVFELNGQVLFNPRHVGACLDLGDSAVRMAMGEMNEKQVIKLTNSDVSLIDIRKLNNAGENFLTESGVYRLVFKSRKPSAQRFTNWVTDEVLPAIRKTGRFQTQEEKPSMPIDVRFSMALQATKVALELLRASDSSIISNLTELCEAFDVSTVGFPKYIAREDQILSATELLKRRDKPMSIHLFNSQMIMSGFLEILERPSTNGQEVRKFKALTQAGLAFGENSVNPKYPMETQPHYYAHKFDELLKTISDMEQERRSMLNS